MRFSITPLAGLALLLITPPRTPLPPAGYRFERTVRDRWLHERQQPAFTPFGSSVHIVNIDSVVNAPAGRTLWLGFGNWLGRMDLDATGRPRGLFPGVYRDSIRNTTAADSADVIDNLGEDFAGGGQLRMPEVQMAELAFPVPTRLARGVTWRDTSSVTGAHGGWSEQHRLTRVFTVIGDSLVSGRHLWVIRDSGTDEMAERRRKFERSLRTYVAIERSATGTIRGLTLYDADLRLIARRADTVRMTGEARLVYPDGRTFRTPARYERTRRYVLLDSAAYVARQDSIAKGNRFSILIQPRTETEKRLAAGDSTLRDSLLHAWDRSDDPDERLALQRLLNGFGRTPDLQARMQAMSSARGDSTALFDELSRAPMTKGPRAAAALDVMLAFMDDPGRAFAFNRDRDPPYESIANALSANLPALLRDSTAWNCAPAMCPRLATLYDHRSDERVHDLGILARFGMDPRRWADTVVAHARAHPGVLTNAAMLVTGAGPVSDYNLTNTRDVPLPRADAPWQEWARWTLRRDTSMNAQFRRSGLREISTMSNFTVSPQVAQVVQFQEFLTGRKIIDELALAAKNATTDSARYVFRTLLTTLRPEAADPEAVIAEFASTSALERQQAQRDLTRLFTGSVPTVDSATTFELMDRVLSIHLAGAAPWQSLRGGTPAPPADARPVGSTGKRQLVKANMPPALVAKWAASGRVTIVDAFRMPPDSERPVEITRVSPVVHAGSIVRVTIDVTSYVPLPGGEAYGMTYYLVQRDGRWYVLSVTTMVA